MIIWLMAKIVNSGIGLPRETVIEVVRTKGDEVLKKTMTFGDWLNLKKLPGYVYCAYQLGFSQYMGK